MEFKKVSCICVTKNRPNHLQDAVFMFNAQNYINKELVVVCDDNDQKSIQIARQNNIQPVLIDSKLSLTLGEIRRVALSQCTGSYVCQWDDDDWYHDNRLSEQMSHLMRFGQSACTLTNWIIYDEEEEKCYLSMHRLWEGSAIISIDIARTAQMPATKLGEDTIFLNDIIHRVGVLPLTLPYLYIYRIHKENSWMKHTNHFKMMAAQAQLLPSNISSYITSRIDSVSSYFELCRWIESKDFLSKLHFFKFNNLNYSNKELIDYMCRIDDFDEYYFKKNIGFEV